MSSHSPTEDQHEERGAVLASLSHHKLSLKNQDSAQTTSVSPLGHKTILDFPRSLVNVHRKQRSSELKAFLPRSVLLAVSVALAGWDAEVQVGHPPVDEMEGLNARAAVDLSFDSLRVRVRRQLLARLLGDQKEGVVFRIEDFELVGAE